MTRLLTLLMVLAPVSAFACDTYTLDGRPPGEKLATMDEPGVLIIDEGQFGKEIYDLRSAGTGIPFQEGIPRDKSETIQVLEHKGDLIINSMVYVPFCGEVQ